MEAVLSHSPWELPLHRAPLSPRRVDLPEVPTVRVFLGLHTAGLGTVLGHNSGGSGPTLAAVKLGK